MGLVKFTSPNGGVLESESAEDFAVAFGAINGNGHATTLDPPTRRTAKRQAGKRGPGKKSKKRAGKHWSSEVSELMVKHGINRTQAIAMRKKSLATPKKAK